MTDPKYMRPGLDFAAGKLVEELGELLAALGKAMRWGRDSFNPELPPAAQEPNWHWIEREIDDVLGAIANYRKEAGTATQAAYPSGAGEGLPADVVSLVVAGREAWEFLQEHQPHDDVTAALDKALERFASRVCYDDDGGDLPEAHADPCTCGQSIQHKGAGQ